MSVIVPVPANKSPATVEDLLALPEDLRVELIGGEIVEKAAPDFDHGECQLALGAGLFPMSRPADHRTGWWLGSEVDVLYGPNDLYRHDVVGWRRDRVGERPKGRPVTIRPDWVCEILSPSNWRNDTVSKFRVLQQTGVPHYWLLDLEHGQLTVLRWQDGSYAIAAVAVAGEKARLEPFEEIELELALLFGQT